MIRAIIVEDEKLSAKLLAQMLVDHCPQVELISTAHEVKEAIEKINQLNPDLVFMDIEMQTGTGFDVINGVQNKKFKLIFTTAYDHYALKAIKFSAVDYLLKPIDVLELTQAIDKIRNEDNVDLNQQKLDYLLKNLNPKENISLSLSTSEGIEFILLKDIIWIEANGAYSQFYIKPGRKLMISKNLKEYEQLLTEHHFYRIHNSYIINNQEVKKIVKADGGFVIMSDGTHVPISPKKKDDFLEILGKSVIS